ncbi:hypothetical protein ACJX0J_016277, partial [Zea mays]
MTEKINKESIYETKYRTETMTETVIDSVEQGQILAALIILFTYPVHYIDRIIEDLTHKAMEKNLLQPILGALLHLERE